MWNLASILTAFLLCLTAAAAEHPNPSVADRLVTSYLSVDGPGIQLSNMEYRVPANATVYQGMLAASQQNNGFQFNSTVHAKYGHFITSINNVEPMGGFYWFIFDAATRMLTPVGVDFLYIRNGSSYIWHYANSTSHNGTYEGPCDGSSSIPPTMPFTYKVVYLSVSDVNVTPAPSGAFMRVYQQPVLTPTEPTSVFRLLEIANSQIPIDVKAELNMQDKTVTSLNGVPNNDNYRWIGYKGGEQAGIPYDLSLTNVTNGDYIGFRYELVTGSGVGAPSAGQSLGLLTVAAWLSYVMTSL